METDNNNTQTPTSRTPSTMEGRENELIALAYDAVERRIKEGTASSAELVHFLELGSKKERQKQDMIEADIALKKAKVKALNDSAHLEQVAQDAIEAMKRYSGNGD